MAVNRQQNWQSAQRVDLPHLRAIDSGVAYDFDVLGGRIIAGKVPCVVSGFYVVESGAVGGAAEDLVLQVADSSLIHFNATESGSIFQVEEGRANETLSSTNSRVDGAFAPSSINYVGLDLVREADDSTADVVQFKNVDSGVETGRSIPLGRVLNYRIKISPRDFSATPTICPIAIVTTSSANNVTALTDARYMLFRLGSGGSAPDANNIYGWTGGRDETVAVTNAVAADKSIKSFQEWMMATMTRIWELGGGEKWYSATADRNVKLVSDAVFASSGLPFDLVTSPSNNLHWQGLAMVFDNSHGYINEIADQTTNETGLTDLAIGECIYVDVDRSQDLTGSDALIAQKGILTSLGTPRIPGSRFVIAWRTGADAYFFRDQVQAIGLSFLTATTTVNGAVRLSATPASSTAPLVATIVTSSVSQSVAGMSGFSLNGTGKSGILKVGGGYGGYAGDQGIEIGPYSTYNTQIQGYSQYSAANRAALKVEQLAGNVYKEGTRIADFSSTTSGGTVGVRVYIDGTGAIGLSPTEVMPYPPVPASGNTARLSVYARPDKFAHTACVYATAAALPTCTYSFGVLTASANGALTVDGSVVVLNNRICVKDQVDTTQNRPQTICHINFHKKLYTRNITQE